MIITELELFNFRQFIGEQIISFSTDKVKNVTVLIGVNTSGKTTLVKAFEWCLYGKIEFEDSILLNNEVKGKMHVGDTQETWVAVTFIHDDITYTLKRSLKYGCKERQTSEDKVIVELYKNPQEKLTLEYLQKDGQTKTPIDKGNIKESIDRVLPKDLSDYFFFGGEKISGIANRTDLSKAVRGLMRLNVLENASEHLKEVLKDFKKEIDTSGDEKAQRASDGLETYTQREKHLEEEKDNADKQVQYWLDKEKEYTEELAKSDIDQVKKAQKERDRIQSALNTEKQRLEDQKREMVGLFSNRTFAYFGLPAISKSLELLENAKSKSNNVHESIPSMEQDAVDHLIKRGYCICGTILDPGTTPYEKVMKERRVLPPEHVGDAVRQYKSKAEGYLAGTEDYKEKIEEKYKDYRTTKQRIGQLQDEWDEQAKSIIDDTKAKEVESKRQEAHIKYKESKADYDTCVSNLGECRKDIKNCEDAIEKYAKGSARNQRISELIIYSESVYELLMGTYIDKETIVKEQLAKRVNDSFNEMYHGKRTIIIDEKYRVKYSDIKTEESPGLKAVKSFAFISSLVSMAKDKILDDSEMNLGQDYPLVMDAPFSNVDEIHIENICKVLPKTANQVIMAVMQKDWDYAVKTLQQYVGKSYYIKKDTDTEDKEIDTATHILLGGNDV